MDRKKKMFFKRNGFEVVSFRSKKNANGPDCYIKQKDNIFTCEIKKCKITQRGSIQIPPVEKNRINDDFILIELPQGDLLLSKMKDHLSLCTKKGYRTLWNIGSGS